MFLDIGHAVINADYIGRIVDLAPDKTGARSVRITMKDGTEEKVQMSIEDVQAQLVERVIPAPADCWAIVPVVDREGDTIHLDFRTTQVVAFRWSSHFKIMKPLNGAGEVTTTSYCGILQSDDTVCDEWGVYGSAKEWKDGVAEEYAAEGKTVRRVDLEPQT